MDPKVVEEIREMWRRIGLDRRVSNEAWAVLNNLLKDILE